MSFKVIEAVVHTRGLRVAYFGGNFLFTLTSRSRPWCTNFILISDLNYAIQIQFTPVVNNEPFENNQHDFISSVGYDALNILFIGVLIVPFYFGKLNEGVGLYLYFVRCIEKIWNRS